MSNSMTVRALMAAAALTVGLTACSSNGNTEDKVSTTTAAEQSTSAGSDSSASSEPSTTTSDDDDATAEAEARAEAANITIDDLPDGWTATPADASEDDSVFDTCGDLDLDEITVAKVRSDNFDFEASDGTSLSLSSTSGVLTSEENATSMVRLLDTDEFASCVTDAFIERVTGATVTGEFTPVGSSATPKLGDQVTALQGDLTITAAGDVVPAKLMVVAIRTDDLVTTVAASAFGAEPDGELLKDLLTLVAERQAS